LRGDGTHAKCNLEKQSLFWQGAPTPWLKGGDGKMAKMAHRKKGGCQAGPGGCAAPGCSYKSQTGKTQKEEPGRERKGRELSAPKGNDRQSSVWEGEKDGTIIGQHQKDKGRWTATKKKVLGSCQLRVTPSSRQQKKGKREKGIA